MKKYSKKLISGALIAIMFFSLLGYSCAPVKAGQTPLKYYSCLQIAGSDTDLATNKADYFSKKVKRGDKVAISGWVLSNIAIGSYTLEVSSGNVVIPGTITANDYFKKYAKDFYNAVNKNDSPTIYAATNSGWSATVDTKGLTSGIWYVAVNAHYRYNNKDYLFPVASIKLEVTEEGTYKKVEIPQSYVSTMKPYNYLLYIADLNELMGSGPAVGYERLWFDRSTNQRFYGSVRLKSDMSFYYVDLPYEKKVTFKFNGMTIGTAPIKTGQRIDQHLSLEAIKKATPNGKLFVGWSPTNSYSDMYLPEHVFCFENSYDMTLTAMFIDAGAVRRTVGYQMSYEDIKYYSENFVGLYDYCVQRIEDLEFGHNMTKLMEKLATYAVTAFVGAIGASVGNSAGAAAGLAVGGKIADEFIPTDGDPEYNAAVYYRNVYNELACYFTDIKNSWNKKNANKIVNATVWYKKKANRPTTDDGNFEFRFK